MVEFVSYNGRYPCLCSGTLVLKIDGVQRSDFSLCSGGAVWSDSDGMDYVESGPWSVEVPEDLKHLQHKIENVVNMNVQQGCCGGCI